MLEVFKTSPEKNGVPSDFLSRENRLKKLIRKGDKIKDGSEGITYSYIITHYTETHYYYITCAGGYMWGRNISRSIQYKISIANIKNATAYLKMD